MAQEVATPPFLDTAVLLPAIRMRVIGLVPNKLGRSAALKASEDSGNKIIAMLLRG